MGDAIWPKMEHDPCLTSHVGTGEFFTEGCS